MIINYMDIRKIYSDYTIIFHFSFFVFLFWNHYIKRETIKIPDKYLKILAVITIIMGIIFYNFGYEIINE
jgi:hypothetical protein